MTATCGAPKRRLTLRVTSTVTNVDGSSIGATEPSFDRVRALSSLCAAQANVQANQFIEEARRAAARLQEQETRKALAAAEAIMVNARESAAQDHNRMLAELKQEVGRLVVQTTSAVTGKILTPEDQRRLAEETAMQLKDGVNKQARGEPG